MSSDNTYPTSFEHLPTEIFLQIFALLSLQEIITAFSGLNVYINSVIRSVIDVSHMVVYNDTDAINSLYFFPTQIIRLVIVNAEIADFTSLINLHFLTLKYGTQKQFDSIRPQYFPMLEILHIKGLHTTANGNTKTINNLFQVILSNGFPRLRICTTSDIGAVTFSDTWTGSPALHTLNLDMTTKHDCEQLRSVCPHLRGLVTYQPLMDDSLTAFRLVHKRICTELRKLELLGTENKCILDVKWIVHFDNNEPPTRFYNTKVPRFFNAQNINVIQCRILPQNEPYCRASFLIEIKLPPEYPFKGPDVIFLDPIYHPNVNDRGEYCCCWGFSPNDEWRPTRPLTDIIKAVTRIIDSEPDPEHCTDFRRMAEYKNDYLKFYKKALRLTLLYGRPRY